jgi:hypothetical protein
MTRLRGRRLDQLTQADMEAIEERVETAALGWHLRELEDAEARADDEEPPDGWEP